MLVNSSQKYIKEVVKRENIEHVKFIEYLDTLPKLTMALYRVASNLLTYVEKFEEMKSCFERYVEIPSRIRVSNSLEISKLRFGEKEGTRRYNEIQQKNSHSLKNLDLDKTAFISDSNGKRITVRNYNFWMIKHGLSENEAKEKVKTISKGTGKKAYDTRKKDPNWKECLTTSIEYYIKKGMSIGEARISLAQRQRTFTLEKLVAKYGQQEGERRWKDRQTRWQKSLNELSDDLKRQIYEKRIEGLNHQGSKNYSKESQKFCERLIFILMDEFGFKYSDFYFATHEIHDEYIMLSQDGKIKMYDLAFVTEPIKIIVEYHGIKFHPKEYDPNWKNLFGVDYETVKQNDDVKEELAKQNGFLFFKFFSDGNFDDFVNKLKEEVHAKIKN